MKILPLYHYFRLRECEELQASFLLDYCSSPLLEEVAEEAQWELFPANSPLVSGALTFHGLGTALKLESSVRGRSF